MAVLLNVINHSIRLRSSNTQQTTVCGMQDNDLW